MTETEKLTLDATTMNHTAMHLTTPSAVPSATEPSATAAKATPASPAMIPIRAFRTPVRGFAFAAPPPGGEHPEPGLAAELAREPDNPADPLAVAVWTAPTSGARWRIGYLDRAVAARVAPRLDAGSRVRAQLDGWSTEPEGRWRRPLLLLLPEEDPAVSPLPTAEIDDPDRSTVVSPTDSGRPSADPDVPRIWGRPPGVRRRRVS